MLYLLSCALKTKAEVAAHRHVLSFKSICFLLWIHELLHLCLVFGDVCITTVECRQFIQKTFIVQTKLKMIWGIKPCPSSGFQCLGKHCSAKSTHVYLLVWFLPSFLKTDELFIFRLVVTYSLSRMCIMLYSMLIFRGLFFWGIIHFSVTVAPSICQVATKQGPFCWNASGLVALCFFFFFSFRKIILKN